MIANWRATGAYVVLGSTLVVGSACRGACFDLDQPQCVDRFTGNRMLAHGFSTGFDNHDAVADAAVELRGDADLGTGWTVIRRERDLIFGFPEAGAVGVLGVLQRIDDCPASSTRLLGYLPDDSLDREPQLQVRVSGCSAAGVSTQVLFNGPSDFGTHVLTRDTGDEQWELWVSGPGEGTERGGVWRYTNAGERPAEGRGHDSAQLLEGTAPGDQLGLEMVGCGDLNGDGIREIAVGVPGFSGTSTLDAPPLSGAVLVIDPTTLPDEGDLSWNNATSVLWGQALDRAGTAIECTQDLNGDGVADLVIGAPLTGDLDEGAVYVVSGAGLPTSGALADSASLTWSGTEPGERLGSSVDAADVDGDGVAELIAGAPGLTDGVEGEGAVRLLLGQDRDGEGVRFNGRMSQAVDGINTVYRLGERSRLADLDGDAIPEIIAGAWRADRDNTSLHAGEVRIWPGTVVELGAGGDPSDSVVIAGESTHMQVGRRIDILDVDGDGTPEVVTSARRRAQ
ncbi:MAG: FG-GAP-like repeat-containing protein [Myxococcota bacterium]